MKTKTIMRAGISILLANIFNKRTPLAVYLSLTDRCPFNCKYCNIPNKKKQKELTDKQIFKLIDELSDMGTQRLHLAGGEPMLREDIGKIINYANDKGIYVTLSSNGYLIPEKIKELKKLGALMLSLDGDKEEHEYHKGKGSFKIVMEAIKAAKANNITILTTTVLTQNSKDSIEFILSLAKKYNFLVSFVPVYFTGLNLKNHVHLKTVPSDLILSNQGYKDLFKKLIKMKKQKEPISSSSEYLEFLYNWDDYSKPYKNIRNNKMKCWAGKLHCYIDTDGSLYPCGDSIDRVKNIPNVKLGFKKAFNSIANNPCKTCIIGCDVEQNLMFSLNTKTIINWMRQVK